MNLPNSEKLTANPTYPIKTVIEPTRGWASLGLSDIWEYRELLYILIFREIRGTYRQTALGISWLIIRPLLNMIVLTVVFGFVVRVPTDNVPYPLFYLAALLPWGYFSNAVMRASGSLVQNMEIISKVYFPRLIIAIACVLSGLVDLLASFLLFLVFQLLYHFPLRLEIIWLPLLTLVVVLFALAIGLWLATLSVKYRDVAFAVNFLLQVLMYASPIIYPLSMVPQKLLWLYNLNPMVSIIQGFRWALSGTGSFPNVQMFVSLITILILLISGAYIFRRTERTIVDML